VSSIQIPESVSGLPDPSHVEAAEKFLGETVVEGKQDRIACAQVLATLAAATALQQLVIELRVMNGD
jgi:hypothetical protein